MAVSWALRPALKSALAARRPKDLKLAPPAKGQTGGNDWILKTELPGSKSQGRVSETVHILLPHVYLLLPHVDLRLTHMDLLLPHVVLLLPHVDL